MKLSETAQLLYDKYGQLTLTTEQLAEVLHYRTPRVLLNAVSAECIHINVESSVSQISVILRTILIGEEAGHDSLKSRGLYKPRY